MRASAIRIAPVAPIAPPSVGVAMPRKIVPSTRKISASGGISTKVTLRAIADSRWSFSALEATASTNATPMPTSMQMTIVSSSARSARSPNFAYAMAAATEMMVSTSSDVLPVLPEASRNTRASGGSAGAHCGLKIEAPIT